MEHHTRDPAQHSKIAQPHIVFPQFIAWRNGLTDLFKTLVVPEEVEEGEDDGERLLHAEDAVKGPFAMELHDATWVVGGELGEAEVRYVVLAGVVAFGGAVPEE